MVIESARPPKMTPGSTPLRRRVFTFLPRTAGRRTECFWASDTCTPWDELVRSTDYLRAAVDGSDLTAGVRRAGRASGRRLGTALGIPPSVWLSVQRTMSAVRLPCASACRLLARGAPWKAYADRTP